MDIVILVNTIIIHQTGQSVFVEHTKKISSVRTEKGKAMRVETKYNIGDKVKWVID